MPQAAKPIRAMATGSRYRYGVLLGLIAASLAFQLAAPVSDWTRLITALLQGATLLLALWTSRARPLLLRIATVAVVLSLAGAAAALVGDGDRGADSTNLVNLVLAAIAPVVVAAGVVRNVREDDGVTLATMFGVLCVYLLLGMTFAFLYAVSDALGDGDLFAQGIDATQADFLYFSFSTLTTTGFGDLTAATGVGRAFAITEALVGQIYLVTVVAAIVSNLRPRRA